MSRQGEPDFGEWRPMGSAPRTGERVLVEIRASEQGAAEVDLVRWARPDRTAEECWMSADSDSAAAVIYEEAELTGWMPLPTPLPKLRSAPAPGPRPSARGARAGGETEGSGI